MIFILEVLHKYDGFIYPKPSSWSAKYAPNWYVSYSALKKRKAFVEEFFPKWTGFCVNNSSEIGIQPLEAVQQLQRLVEDMCKVQAVDTTKKLRTFSVPIQDIFSVVGI